MRLTEKHIECAKVCARLEDRGPEHEKNGVGMWWNAFQFLQIGSKMMHFWPRKPVAKRFSGLTCPIFRSRTAGIASRSAPGLRTSVRPVRIAVVRLGSRHEVFDIGALSIINFDPCSFRF